MKSFSVLLAVYSVLFSVMIIFAAETANDHLVPVPRYSGASLEYRRLAYRKLIVTSENIVTFIQLPGSNRMEFAVAVHRTPDKTKKANDEYWVTATEAASSIYAHSDNAKIKKREARLPQSTAEAVQKLWLKMLHDAKPIQNPERYLSVDTTTTLLSAMSQNGTMIEAEGPKVPLPEGSTTDELIKIAYSLADYCDVHLPDRPELAAKIEKRALDLLRR
jgi:hypothetical protein